MPERRKRRDTADLRRQAEKALEELTYSPGKPNDLSPDKIHRMLYELQVHQIELEMQKDELEQTQLTLDDLHAKYFDLYELAPTGYLTLDENAFITEANLTAAALLGAARGDLVRQSLPRFILPEDQDIYYLHRKKLFASGEPQSFELRMVKKDGTVFWAHLDSALSRKEKIFPCAAL